MAGRKADVTKRVLFALWCLTRLGSEFSANLCQAKLRANSVALLLENRESIACILATSSAVGQVRAGKPLHGWLLTERGRPRNLRVDWLVIEERGCQDQTTACSSSCHGTRLAQKRLTLALGSYLLQLSRTCWSQGLTLSTTGLPLPAQLHVHYM